MATFKGDSAQLSIVTEDNGYGKPPTTYDGGKMIQTNDGTLNATRNALESAARTPIAELAGARLGNKQVAGNFPIEIDAFNQRLLWESLLYGRFDKNGGSDASLTGASFSGTKKYELVIDLNTAAQTSAGIKIGNAYMVRNVAEAALSNLEGAPLIATAVTATEVTFFCPQQTSDTLAATTSDVDFVVLDTLRPAKQSRSFNIEERLYAEDGSTTARFMSSGGIVSGVNIDLPSEGIITGDFTFVGRSMNVSSNYADFDPTLTNSADAHTNIVPHTKYDPMVLQDGAIVSGEGNNIACQWLGGSMNIENGTETYFVGCSFEAAGAFSGKLNVTFDFEALFESEDDFLLFESEQQSRVLLHLKDPNSDQCLLVYLPSFKRMSYTKNVSTGLVSASLQARAIIDDDAGNSIIIAAYNG